MSSYTISERFYFAGCSIDDCPAHCDRDRFEAGWLDAMEQVKQEPPVNSADQSAKA